MEYYGVLLYVMAYYGILWYIMVYSGRFYYHLEYGGSTGILTGGLCKDQPAGK